MSSASTENSASRTSQVGEPVWELAELYPRQGAWSESDYLNLETNRLVEFNLGRIEFLPMPSLGHQRILGYLLEILTGWARFTGSPLPVTAPMPVLIDRDRYREPDLLLPDRVHDGEARRITSPRLVMEVVSPGAENQRRDAIEKRADYASAGIPEYWIIDPETETVTILTLPEKSVQYVEFGIFRPGEHACSALLSNFSVDVSKCFAAGKGGPA